MQASVQLALFENPLPPSSCHDLSLQVRRSRPPLPRYLSPTAAAAETMMFTAPAVTAATNHLGRRGRSLRAVAATRAASSAVAAMSAERVPTDARLAGKGRRRLPGQTGANMETVTAEAAAAVLAARGAWSAAAVGPITSAEGASPASSLTPRVSRAAAAGPAATRSPATGTTRASARGCRRPGPRASFPCCPGPE